MSKPQVYVDADVFLNLFQAGREDRHPAINYEISKGESNEVQLVTSTLTIAEVLFGKDENDQRILTPEIQAKIDNWWHPKSVIDLIEPSQLFMYEAARIQRKAFTQGVGLVRANDAVHLACAVRRKASCILTYDERMMRYESVIEIPIRNPEDPPPVEPEDGGLFTRPADDSDAQ